MGTDRELLARYVEGGDLKGFFELMERYSGFVHMACWKILKERHAAEDARQAVFILLAERSGELLGREEEGGIRNWLYFTARNVALAMKKKIAIRTKHERRAGCLRLSEGRSRVFEGWKKQVHPAPDWNDLLAHLPNKQRDVLVLHFLKGLSRMEVAKALGCTTGTVASRMARGLANLRLLLAHRALLV